MQARKFNVVTDGFWGSCGKGSIMTALTAKYRPQIISTTSMANSGHTAVNVDGEAFIAKALPSAAILTKWLRNESYQPQVVVGASAAFNLEQLLHEIAVCGTNYSTSIHPRAGVITKEHRQQEAGDGQLSTKHLASTMQGCGTFLADKVLRKKTLKLARDYPELESMMANYLPRRLHLDTTHQEALMKLSLPEMFHALMVQHDFTILHEGSQGFSLDINHGSHYPACTSRGTTAPQNMADMGISPYDLGDVFLVIRPYPIRVGNVVENGKQVGYSGDCYPDQQELTWQQVADEAGMPKDVADSLLQKELTTVTKRLRRVFTFSDSQLRESALVNGATKIALNFANYVDYSVYGAKTYEQLTPKVLDFMRRIEDVTKLPVTIIGTGPQIDHVIML
jgi:adenylosuccinate synthase